jgi:single-strand DNA-binding protein
MAKGLNKVQLIGHLGQDPDLKYTQNGTAIANVSLATTEQWTDNNGEKQQKTEWHRLVAWRKLAEVFGEWLKKGQLIYVEGKLQTDEWEKEGQKHYTTKVVVNQMIMLGGGQGQGSDKPRPAQGDFSGGPTGDFSGQQYDGPDDDIPF